LKIIDTHHKNNKCDAVQEEQQLTEIEDVADASDEIAEQQEDVAAADQIVAEEGLTPGVYMFLKRMGVIDAGESFGMTMPAYESLNAGSRNEEYVAKVRAALEEADKSLFQKAKEAIRALIQRIVNFFKNLFVATERMKKSIVAAAERYSKVKSIDPEKGKAEINIIDPSHIDEYVSTAKEALAAAQTHSDFANGKGGANVNTHDIKSLTYEPEKQSKSSLKVGDGKNILSLLDEIAKAKKTVSDIETAGKKAEASKTKEELNKIREHIVAANKQLAAATRYTLTAGRIYVAAANAYASAAAAEDKK
jgi:hypothetical protein